MKFRKILVRRYLRGEAKFWNQNYFPNLLGWVHLGRLWLLLQMSEGFEAFLLYFWEIRVLSGFFVFQWKDFIGSRGNFSRSSLLNITPLEVRQRGTLGFLWIGFGWSLQLVMSWWGKLTIHFIFMVARCLFSLFLFYLSWYLIFNQWWFTSFHFIDDVHINFAIYSHSCSYPRWHRIYLYKEISWVHFEHS